MEDLKLNEVHETTLDGCVFRYTYQYNKIYLLTSYFDLIITQTYSLTYDKQGNLTSKEDYLGTTNYSWNSKNRLTKLTLPTGEVFTYSYSPNGTRLTKGSSKGSFTKYSYSGIKLQSEVTRDTGRGTITTSFNYTPDGEPYSLKRSSATYYYHLNAHGDVISLTDQQIKEVASYSYGPWGNEEKAKGSLADSNQVRYAGYYYDSDADMYYLISRYYDASLGRFISRDATKHSDRKPIGRNEYIYCNNDPIGKIDPTGGDAIEAIYVAQSEWYFVDECQFQVEGSFSYWKKTKMQTVGGHINYDSRKGPSAENKLQWWLYAEFKKSKKISRIPLKGFVAIKKYVGSTEHVYKRKSKKKYGQAYRLSVYYFLSYYLEDQEKIIETGRVNVYAVQR